MKTFHRNSLAAALLLALSAVAPAYAGEVCVLDDGAGNTSTGGATAPGIDATACGTGATASGDGSTAMGANSTATGIGSSAFGASSLATGDAATAVGTGAEATNFAASAFGAFASASGDSATATGAASVASGEFSTANGAFSEASGARSTAVGYNSVASGATSTALGADSQATAANSVALGANSVADRANTVSVGSATTQRQLTNLAAGTASTDAVNVAQISSIASAFGGGASFSGGVFTAPSYMIQGASYGNVGAAFAAVDSRLSTLSTQVAGGANSVQYDSTTRSQVTLGGAQGTRVTNVANGTASTDAVNVRQLQASSATTLQSANSYTDQRISAITLDMSGMRMEMDDRFDMTDRRISRNGAMSAAMMQMAANSAYAKPDRGRLSMGAGFQEGEAALSVGYGRRFGDSVSMSIGAAFSGSDNSAGVGFGVDL